MESSLVFLCLWICFIVYASTSNGCPEIPVVENAEVSESSKKKQYSDGDTLNYNCVHGYVSLRKIIYKCSNNEWTKRHDDKCSLKRCESPEDIPNGRYIIESGRNFVFGTTIKYICNDGYQIMSRFDTRTCRDGGWDNQLPVCEEVSCERKTSEGVRVEGLPDHSEDLIRSGHRLTFSCVDHGLILRGQKEITCQSNGEWSSPFPKCVEATCPLQWSTIVKDLKIEGLPDIEGPVKPGHRLTFSCTGEGMKLNGQRDITCWKNGEWSRPFPKCQVNMRSDRHLGPEVSIRPGHTITLSCVGRGSTLQRQSKITCLSNGEWRAPFPKCIEIACEGEQLINVEILYGHPGIDSPYKPGHILLFRCTDVNLKLNGHRAIECLSNGKWDQPYPICEEITCEVPRDQHVSRPNNYFSGDMKLGARTFYRCESGYRQTAAEATCTRDGWTPNPLCAEITCEVPRDQHVSRPSDYFSEDMKMEARRSYRCEPGYRQTASMATCTENGWTPNPLCAEITCELQSTTTGVKKINPEGKTIFRAGESVEITCSEKGSSFDTKETSKSFTCQENGQWDHKPVCEEIRCEVPRDQHVYLPYNYFRGDMKLGARISYRCESGYHQIAAEATCTQDGWTPKTLCAVPGICGPPPPVNDGDTIKIPKKEYNTGERVEYICFSKYTLDLRRPFSKYLTCQQGEWTGNIKCLKPCTVTVEKMNERGIELAFADQQKMFAPHDDHLSFRCQWRKVSVGIVFRQKCDDGVMTLPKCV